VKERLLYFLFWGILLAFAVNLAIDQIHVRLFSMSRDFQTYWYIPFIAVPSALLLALAWVLGFYRKGGSRGADALSLLLIAGLIYATLGAGYSCWHYCF
jgi:hypothetical protein